MRVCIRFAAQLSTLDQGSIAATHGGGFQLQTTSDPTIDGASLAARGVLVVTVNYRLGVFGFLAHPSLDAEAGVQKSGMYGMQDMVAALRWLKDNVAAFGGDPDNLTIAGESAGAHAVGMLMTSPLAKGLFHKAIGESGAFWESEHGAMPSHEAALQRGLDLQTKELAGALAALRAVPAYQLQRDTDYVASEGHSVTNFAPSVDGYVLADNPYVVFMNGRQNDVPLLAGWNADEGLIFAARGLPHDTVENYTSAAQEEFGAASLADFLSFYPAGSTSQASASSVTLAGDQIISQQTWSWVDQQSRTGHAPAYAYNFGFTSPMTPVAAHTTEVPYVFGNLRPNPMLGGGAAGATDMAMSAQMQQYWVNFARTGNPNGTGLAAWPTWSAAG